MRINSSSCLLMIPSNKKKYTLRLLTSNKSSRAYPINIYIECLHKKNLKRLLEADKNQISKGPKSIMTLNQNKTVMYRTKRCHVTPQTIAKIQSNEIFYYQLWCVEFECVCIDSMNKLHGGLQIYLIPFREINLDKPYIRFYAFAHSFISFPMSMKTKREREI